MAKKTKVEVDYSRGMKDRRCKNCVHFIRHEGKRGGCTLVAGLIDPEFWCKLFKRAT